MSGLIHIYCGNGKGKTTAAAGLALRAAGAGKRVLFAQFLKDGSSSEISVLRQLDGVTVRHCDTARGWFRTLSGREQDRARRDYNAFLEELIAEAGRFDLLVLDEAAAACRYGAVEERSLLTFLREKPEALEVVLTGREPPESLLSAADYVTEMRKIKHPFDRGIPAREGVEF
ncbi:MAG: cob(I)yrinic acid a,c-diamide adenosyltransferase [Oscillospiraceae bacterium]|nr:cob(I)yrinic acid a,c-diamide adenosyltransferase [Oscillospiraceae bacterium]